MEAAAVDVRNDDALTTVDDSAVNLTTNANATEPPLPPLPETTAYWSREPYAWSTSIQDYTPPLLTSSKCSRAFYDLFRNTYYTSIGSIDPLQPNFLLSVIVESSSHPSGLNALFGQPYMYAGPGLGNMDICPLQTCIAGGRSSDSITFASVCTVPECSAYDLASEDFVSTIARQYDFAMDDGTPQETIDLGREYVLLLRRIAEINKFLKTGWTCGAFVVPFEWFPFGLPYVLISLLLVAASVYGTTVRKGRHRPPSALQDPDRVSSNFADNDHITMETAVVSSSSFSDEETSNLLVSRKSNGSNFYHGGSHSSSMESRTTPSRTICEKNDWTPVSKCENASLWSAFDAARHLQRLMTPDHAETACLDGLRVGSIFWIMLGHVMAIQSSSGAGYSNPSNFLPPAGLTTTLLGQLLFSSRLAVDTFLVISGYLVVHVLLKKVPLNPTPLRRLSFWKHVVLRYVTTIPSLLLTRMGRILPLYAMSLGFYTQIAPQLGGGPFWHQWIHLLQPCHDAVWTNFFFVNNFIPFETPTTSTCFYHSWYLAVDMQLFVLAPLLVFWYQYRRWHGLIASILLFVSSVLLTAFWSYTRGWSVNTFDGSLVMKYDVEAYANPLIRAQSYLAGMYMAMLLHNQKERCAAQPRWRAPYCWRHRTAMALSLLTLLVVTFFSVTGAYARRPCTYEEDPFLDICGSSWSPLTTFVYTAFGRTIWVIGICIVIYLCIDRGKWSSGDSNLVAAVLSWTCWTPLSQLTFGAYLIHPIVIFVWQLGDREKRVFRLITFAMDYLSVCVVSFVAALVAVILIEFPFAILWKNALSRSSLGRSTSRERMTSQVVPNACPAPLSVSPLTPPYEDYGTLKPFYGQPQHDA